MVNTNTFIEANWHRKNKYLGHPQQWYQSKIQGKPLRRITQTEFTQRHNKREKEERIGRCMRQITRDCRNMLKKKLEEVEVFNASIPENKYVNYNYAENMDTLQIDVHQRNKTNPLTEIEGEMPRLVEDTDSSEVHTFHGFVAFLNLIKKDDIISKDWDAYRKRFDKVLKWFYNYYLKRALPRPIPPVIHGVPIYLFDLHKLMDCMGGYLSVQFG
ncbi:ARID DNA-binding domain-containing protein [Tanacetum coccineum]